MNVLFLGNSFLHRGLVPLRVRAIAQKQSHDFVHYSVTPEGCSLNDHLMSDEVEFAMRFDAFSNATTWDAMVLQPHSLGLCETHGKPQRCLNDALELIKLFRSFNKNARVLFVLPWPRQKNATYGQKPFYQSAGALRSPQTLVEGAYAQSAALLSQNVERIRMGQLWLNALSHIGDDALYDPDGSHAAPSGQWLFAAALYAHIFRERVFLLPSGACSKIEQLIKDPSVLASSE